MMIGTIDFMIMSGLSTPIDAMPMPDLAVPYAAPRSINICMLILAISYWRSRERWRHRGDRRMRLCLLTYCLYLFNILLLLNL